MKKFLLFAVAALIVGSANAQKLTGKQSGLAKSRLQLPVMKAEKKAEGPVQQFIKAGYKTCKTKDVFKELMPEAKASMKNLRATNRLAGTVSRRAGAVQATYTGYGTDYLDNDTPVSWTMKSGDADGVAYLADIIPNPFAPQIDYVLVAYKLSGNTVTIAPQKVASGGGYYVYVFSWASADGSIVFTLGDNGSLTTVKGESIAYGIFTTDAFPSSLEELKRVEDGGTYAGMYACIDNVSYLMEGETPKPVVEYEANGLLLHVGSSLTGYSWQKVDYAVAPAFVPVVFRNFTPESTLVDTWSWRTATLQYDSSTGEESEVEVFTGSDRNFTLNSIGDEYYSPIELIGSFQGVSSDPFKWGLMNGICEDAYIYAGATSDGFAFLEDYGGDGSSPMLTKVNADDGIYYSSTFATPDKQSNKWNMTNLISYQGKPESPLYFEGVGLALYQMKANPDFNLKCKIVKAKREFENRMLVLGDVIAQADLTYSDIEVGEYQTFLHWNNFYVEDEFGMTEEVPYLFIEDEFAIVFEGWNNGTFSAYTMIDGYDRNNSLPSTFFNMVDEEGNYYATGNYQHLQVGFSNAAYGFLYTTDDTNLTIPATGGTASLQVTPMLYSVNAERTEKYTRLWIEKALTDTNLEDDYIYDEEGNLVGISWLSIDVANEEYTGEVSKFDLVFAAEALPEGVSSRSANIVFAQEGALLKVTVTQGEATGISVTTKTVKTGNAQMFNLAGQRVNSSFKGLVVKDGKKFMNK